MLTARDFSDLSYAEKEHLLDVLRASRGLLAGAFGPPDSAADDAVFPLALPPAEPDSVPTPFSDRSILTDALGALAHVSQGALAESLLQEGLDADSAEPIDPLPLLKAASVLIDGCLARLGYRKDGTVEPPSSYDGFSARELLVLVLGVLAEAKMCEDLGLSGHEGEELANGHANGAAVYENGEGSGSKADSDRHVRQAVELVHSLHDKFFIELYGYRSKVGSKEEKIPHSTRVSHETLLAYISFSLLNQRTPNRRLRKELNDLRNPTSYLLAKAAPAVDSGVDHLLRLFTLQFVAQSDKTQKFRAGILKGAADALGVGKGATAYLAAVAGGQLDHGDRELFKRACEASREVETRFTGKRRTVRDRAMIVLAANAEVLRKDKFGSDFEVVP